MRISESVDSAKPGLFIGLGDFGAIVASQLRQRVTAEASELSTSLGFLSISFEASDSRDPDEVVLTQTPGEDRSLRWWYPGLPFVLDEPARVHGRLLLLDSFDGLRHALRQAEARCRNAWSTKPEVRVDFAQPTSVYLVSAMGILETGLLNDLCFVIKQTLGPHRCTLQLFLAEAPVPDSEYQRARLQANLYAFCKELNHFALGDKPPVVDWLPGRPFTAAQPHFDTCFILDPRSTLPFEVAESVMNDFLPGPIPAHLRSARTNFRRGVGREAPHQEARLSPKFSSFRLSLLGLSSRDIKRYCALKCATEVVRVWHGKGNQDEMLARTILEDHSPLMNEADTLFALLDSRGTGEPESGRVDGLDQRLYRRGQDLMVTFREHGCDPDVLLDETRLLTVSVQDSASDIAMTLSSNRAALEAATRKRLDQLINLILADSELGLSGAEHVLTVLHQHALRQAETLTAQIEATAEDARKLGLATQTRLGELVYNHQKLFPVPSRQARILRSAEAYLEVLLGVAKPLGSLQCQLKIRALTESLKVSEMLVRTLAGQSHPATSEDGVLKRIEMARSYFTDLAKSLNEHVNPPAAQTGKNLTVSLTPNIDLEAKYREYLGPSERLGTLGFQILSRIGASLLEIAEERALDQTRWEHDLIELCEEQFRGIASDLHVLRYFFEQSEQDQVSQLETLLASCLGPEATGHRGGSYLLVGLPSTEDARTPSEAMELRRHKERFKTLLKSWVEQPLHFLELPGNELILFYSEIGGVPLNCLLPTHNLRVQYERFLSAGEPLHSDCRQEGLEDITVATREERIALEEAVRALVLGQILNIVEIKNREVFWHQRRGLFLRTRALGSFRQALSRLTSDINRRQSINNEIEAKVAALQETADQDRLVRFAFSLNQAKTAVFGEAWGQVAQADELPFLRYLEVEALSLEEKRLARHPILKEKTPADLTRLFQQLSTEREALRYQSVGPPPRPRNDSGL